MPSIGYLRGRTTDPSSGRTTGPTFAMIPEEVLVDERLSHRDVRVYGLLARSRRGPFVSCGERRVAFCAKINRRSARASIAKLVDAGYVSREESKHGSRARYRLTSPLFAKQAAKSGPAEKTAIGVELGAVGKQKVAERAQMVKCPRCSKQCKALLKVGWCRACRWDDKVDGRIERKLKAS